jgi:acyl-CoA reductase-like NAD-dependent aldehyde dehydrogenase
MIVAGPRLAAHIVNINRPPRNDRIPEQSFGAGVLTHYGAIQKYGDDGIARFLRAETDFNRKLRAPSRRP